ncbi:MULTISPECIES: arginine--tRNA ligase [unclassified Lysinibacillus]|uniref:arginine--tRNA ligase n=1 Tax=unclassified Lysinibacillus TaxID=2636778 RepID=UPI002557A163|nr:MULTISPECIES: arginine--tRNA ligase [unclassified Lysinibacillus]MDM5248369.1 arginine--tRNA ligase [Lysinibacillus sp. G4S2]
MYKQIAKSIAEALNNELTFNEIQNLLEKPKNLDLGDVAFPCFTLAKKLRKSPHTIAVDIQNNLRCDFIQEVQVVAGYVNIFYHQPTITKQVLSQIVKEKNLYGTVQEPKGNVVLDFSSPNIAKPFSLGHLRSTVIGNALANIAEKNGYKAIRINHLGDWGTQFGKLIVAYRRWGDQQTIEAAPIEELLKIYVQFHEEAEKDDTLNEQARAAFKALEDGDEEALALWQWFRDASLVEFKTIYQLLGIDFDSFAGEAFYNDKMAAVVQELEEKELLVKSDGAYVVEIDNMPPCLITKTDGATLYATRDLAAAIYRKQQYDPQKIFYVVGNEQSLHFSQLFKVIEKMGYNWAKDLQHVPFGMILKDGKKMSTRKGKIVLLADVLKEAITTAKRNIEEKNPMLEQKDSIAHQVGVGAVIFNDLKNNRLHDIEFSIEHMMNFEGETGPYIQYTYARISSLLEKADFNSNEVSFEVLGEQAWPVILLLEQFPKVVVNAFEQADPSQIAKYALQLARLFNKYYAQNKVLVDDNQRSSRLAFCQCVSVVLKESLALLGIDAPKHM